jgi:hypothetical protein
MLIIVYFHKLRVDNVLPYVYNHHSLWTTEVTTTLSLTSGDILRGNVFFLY